jgi:hypothetical protein
VLSAEEFSEEVMDRIAICIGCGCDDTHACINDLDEPCSWLVVDRREQRGVCTECTTHLQRYKAGDRAFGAVFSVLARQNRIRRVSFCARRRGHGTAGGSVWAVVR